MPKNRGTCGIAVLKSTINATVRYRRKMVPRCRCSTVVPHSTTLNYLVYLLLQIYHGTRVLHICCRKLQNRMYCIIYLVNAGVPVCDMLCVYCNSFCSSLEHLDYHRDLITKKFIQKN